MKRMEVRSAELQGAIAAAVDGRTAELFRHLEVNSGLPGPRMNQTLALVFAQECARQGARADALVQGMAALPPDEARGASTKEFLSVCGVLAVAARAAGDASRRDAALALLEEKAEDVRFRVRDAVPLGLTMLGAKMGLALAERLLPWMDRYFQAAAVLRALAEPTWLDAIPVAAFDVPCQLLEDALTLAHDAPRSASRYPGHKALVETLGQAPKMLARRFQRPVLDRLATFAAGLKMPELRAMVLASIEDAQLKRSLSPEVKRVKDAVEGSKKPPRDPSRIVHGTRGRGRKRDA